MHRRLLTILLCFGAPAQASWALLPTDVDLKASYCAGKIRYAQIGEGSEDQNVAAFAKEYNARVLKAQNRLKAYLLPKVGTLDIDGMQAAMDLGVADFKNETIAHAKCMAERRGLFGCVRAAPKLDECLEAAFLPF